MKKILIIFVITFAWINSFSQKTDFNSYINSPLDSIFRENSDTVFVFNITSHIPNYNPIVYLIKKDNIVNIYKYGVEANLSQQIPVGIRPKLWQLHKDYFINRNKRTFDNHISLVNISNEESNQFWNEFMNLNPLEMKDDLILGSGCTEGNKEDSTKNTNIVYDHTLFDGNGKLLTMITKNEIKHFYFYAPEHYLERCKERKSRKIILEIEKLFSRYAFFKYTF